MIFVSFHCIIGRKLYSSVNAEEGVCMFSDRLKELRKEKGLTQAELALSLGISTPTVVMWETGKRKPQFEMLNKLYDVFGDRFPYLIGSITYPAPDSEAEEENNPDGWIVQDAYEDTVRKYVLLDDIGQHAVDALIRSEFARCQEQATLNSGNGISVSVKVKQ